MPLTDTGEQHTKIIVDFCDRADGGTRIAASRFLLNADGRRKTAKVINIRLLQLTQKLAGVTRQRFDIAPLAFGIKGVESERAFPRSTHPREDNEPITRQLEIDALQVMLASAPNDDSAVVHQRLSETGAAARPERTLCHRFLTMYYCTPVHQKTNLPRMGGLRVNRMLTIRLLLR